MKRQTLELFVSFGIFVLLCQSLYAQGTSGSIVGTVKDPSGAIIPGAPVVVRNEGTNVVRNTTSNESGDYNVPLLPPGVYEVLVEQTGFRNAVYSDVNVAINQTVRVDVTLVVGNQSEVIDVTGTAPLVNTDTSSVGQVVDLQSVTELPINQRNFVSFAYLVPGVQLPAQGTNASTQGIAMNVNGARDTMNNYLIDGVDDNDLVINQYSAIPSLDAIQEFKVQSGNYSAEYGRSAGGQVNVLLKSGTNQFHGTGYEFVRNRHMDAKNFFDQPDCKPESVPGTCSSIPRLDRSQFGGSFGGPVVKDKTFFFVAYEYLNLHQAATRRATVPSQVQKQQALAAVPSSLINQAGLNVFNLYPSANVGANLATSNTFVSSPTSTQTTPYFVVRGDHRLGQNDTLNGHYALSWWETINAFDPITAYTNLPGFPTRVLQHGQNGGLDWTHVVSPKLVNELRVGFNGEDGEWRLVDNTNYNLKLGFPDVTESDPDGQHPSPSIYTGWPNINIAGYDGIGQPTTHPQIHPTYTIHTTENLAWNPAAGGGKHQLKFGFENRYYIYSLIYSTVAPRGVWTFNGGPAGNSLNPTRSPLVQLLLGTPDNATNINKAPLEEWRTSSINTYIQDDYHVSPRLTVNLGLRWEYNAPPIESNGHASVPDLSPASATCSPKPTCQFNIVGTNGLARRSYLSYYKNFDPRIGFAFRPLNTDRLVIRAAYGIYTDEAPLNVNLNLGLQPPFRNTNQILNPTGTLTIQSIVNASAAAVLQTASFLDPHFRDAYVQQWNLDVQQSLMSNLLFDVAYLGTRGVHLVGSQNLNQPNIGQPIPYPQFGATVNMTNNSRDSWYNSMQVKLEKRGAKGAFLSSYTWSRCIDDGGFGGAGGGSTAQYAFDLKNEKGLCAHNTSQRLAFSSVYEVPAGPGHSLFSHGMPSYILGNWQVSGIVAYSSGQPFTIGDAVPQSGTLPTGSQDRPDSVGNPLVGGPVAANPNCVAPAEVGTPNAWFNPCAFVFAPGRFGNAGRNSLNAPAYANVDFSLLKNIPLSEARRLQFRAEAYNLFNHPELDIPNHTFGSPTFGQILTSNAYGGRPPRQIQLGLKFIF